MPKISVVMPVYNTNEIWLKEAIESILNQSYQDFELIIADDGSKSYIEEIIKKYLNNDKENKIKYLKLPHRGLSSTLNSGFDFAKGEYIARMDADDISLSDRFKLQVEFLENNPTCSVVGGFVETFGDMEEIWKYPKQLKYLDLIKGCFMAHPTIMLRRDDFNKYNLRYKTNILCEDYELWSRAIRFLNFCNIQEVLLKYRIHGNNLSLNPEIKNSDFVVRDSMLNFLTDDVELKEAIMEKLHPVKKKTFLEQIFSIRNVLAGDEKYKELCIAGLNFKIKKY